MERTMAVADPSRWRIVHLLAEGTRTVTQVAEETGLSVAATCRHVQRLRGVGLVEASRHGKELHCRLADPGSPIGQWLEELLGREVPALAVSPSTSPPAEARSRARRPISVRPRPARTAAPSRPRRPAHDSGRAAVATEAPRRPLVPSRELEDYLL